MKHVVLTLLLLPVAALAQQLPPTRDLLTQPPGQQSGPTDLMQPPGQQQQQPPLQQQWQQEGATPIPSPNAPTPPPDQQSPDQQSPDEQTGQLQPAPVPDNQGPATFAHPNVWVPATVARIQALDKVNAQSKDFIVKVGQSAAFGSLTITVKSCVVRPSDQPEDAAAFLAVTDSHPDSGGFNGWMLQNEPSVSMMENPIYDLRVDGCT